jgi:acetylornithine deacetylase
MFVEVDKYVNEESVIKLAQNLVRIPSYAGEEAKVAEFLASRLKQLGLEVSMMEVAPGRPNVIGKLRGNDGGKSFILNGHTDHNMVSEGWTKNPFGGEVEDGWLFGIGAVNMKGALAAITGAVEALVNSKVRLSGDVIVEFVVGELNGGIGTRHTLENQIIADFFVVAEPTELNLITSHTGITTLRITTIGKTGHYISSIKKISAIDKMIVLIKALGPNMAPLNQDGWLKYSPVRGFEGLPQLNIGTIRGGISRDYKDWRPSLVPDRCSIIVDIRTIPGQTDETILRNARELLDSLRMRDPDFEAEVDILRSPFINHPPFHIDPGEAIVKLCEEAYFNILHQKASVGGIPPYKFQGTDAAKLAYAGMKGVVCGAGGKYVSVPNERIRISDIFTASRIYAQIAASICAASKGEKKLL